MVKAKQKPSTHGNAIEPRIAELNERHFVVSVAGKTRVGTDRDLDGNEILLELSRFQDFRERYSNHLVEAGEKLVGLGTYWLRHPWRRQYDRIVFDPQRVSLAISIQSLARFCRRGTAGRLVTLPRTYPPYHLQRRSGVVPLRYRLDGICGSAPRTQSRSCSRPSRSQRDWQRYIR